MSRSESALERPFGHGSSGVRHETPTNMTQQLALDRAAHNVRGVALSRLKSAQSTWVRHRDARGIGWSV
eukprot:scaffold279435_cov33-Tisochrysis_lutea.AAC.1